MRRQLLLLQDLRPEVRARQMDSRCAAELQREQQRPACCGHCCPGACFAVWKHHQRKLKLLCHLCGCQGGWQGRPATAGLQNPCCYWCGQLRRMCCQMMLITSMQQPAGNFAALVALAPARRPHQPVPQVTCQALAAGEIRLSNLPASPAWSRWVRRLAMSFLLALILQRVSQCSLSGHQQQAFQQSPMDKGS